MAVDLSPIDESLLAEIANIHGMPKGAFNIRKDGQLVERHSSANIEIATKTDNPGIDIRIKAGTKGETVYILSLIHIFGAVRLRQVPRQGAVRGPAEELHADVPERHDVPRQDHVSGGQHLSLIHIWWYPTARASRGHRTSP